MARIDMVGRQMDKRMRFWGRPVLALAALMLMACGTSHVDSTDGGQGLDGGVPSDSGSDDGGYAPDAWPLGDSGSSICPADEEAAIGTACAIEGQSCGAPCTDACSFCNLLQCVTGSWQRLEAFPAPCFRCGDDLECVTRSQYCNVSGSDVVGEPDLYSCTPTPERCADGVATCECLAAVGTFPSPQCTESPEGGVTILHPGG